MAFHITITDLDTNEVLIDQDTDAVAAFVNSVTSIKNINRIACDMNDFCHMVASMRCAIDKLQSDAPPYIKAFIEHIYAQGKSVSEN